MPRNDRIGKMDEKEKKAQEMYMEYQVLDQRIKQAQKQLELIMQQIMEANSTSRSLEEFRSLKEGSEILVPLTSGIFARASLKDPSELLVNVGAGTVVTKDISSAKKLISGQVEEMQKVQQKMSDDLEKMMEKAGQLEMELQKIVSEQ